MKTPGCAQPPRRTHGRRTGANGAGKCNTVVALGLFTRTTGSATPASVLDAARCLPIRRLFPHPTKQLHDSAETSSGPPAGAILPCPAVLFQAAEPRPAYASQDACARRLSPPSP